MPEKCDLCDRAVVKEYYDAKIPQYGGWGNICGQCFKHEGCQLGTGYGQHFKRDQPTDEWKKVKNGKSSL